MTSLLADAMKRTASVVSNYQKQAERRARRDPGLVDIETPMVTRPGEQTVVYGSDAAERYRLFRHWVYIAVDSVASAVAGLPWRAAEITNAEANPERRMGGWQHKVPGRILEKAAQGQEMNAIVSHPVLDLLAKPNQHQGKYEFIYFSVCNLELTGVSYWLLGTDDEGRQEQLFAVPSNWIRYDRKRDMYMMQVAGTYESVDIPPEYVTKTSFPNPADPLGYYSPLSACYSAIKVDDYIQRSQAQAFDRGIHPNLIVTVGATPGTTQRPVLTGAQRRQYIRAIREIWSQTVNIGDPAILDGLIESVHKLQSTPQEMDWTNSGEIVKKRIIQTYRVNPYIFGEVTGTNRAQAAVAEDVFLSKVVNPLAGALSTTMTEFLGYRYDTPKRLVVYLEEAMAKDREQLLREWSTLRRTDDVTQDEYRAAVLGLSPMEKRDDPSSLLQLVGGFAGIITLLQQVGAGLVTSDQAVQLLVRLMRVPEEDARAIVGSAGPLIPPPQPRPPLQIAGSEEEEEPEEETEDEEEGEEAEEPEERSAATRGKARTVDRLAFREAIQQDHIKRYEAAEGELGQALAEFFRRHYAGVDQAD